MRVFVFSIAFFLSILWGNPLSSAMSGGDFTIYADTFNFIDTVSTSGDIFSITGTGGEFAATTTGNGTFTLRGGFQAAEQGILSYAANASSVTLGSLSSSAVTSGQINVTISTDSETGYTLSVTENGNLRSGSDDIDDVSDGSVTAGSEEYGIRTSGTDGLLSSDTAISGTLSVASSFGRVTERQTSIIFSASVSPTTPEGDYSHVVSFTATVNP